MKKIVTKEQLKSSLTKVKEQLDVKANSSDVTTELAKKLDSSLKGTANGVAELDATGRVPSSQLPSYVDDVIEGYLYDGKFYEEDTHTTEIVGESGKIYIDLATDKTYRWSGTVFVVISDTITLGETESTAYRGDRGKIAYDHSQTAHAPADAEANVIETVKVNGEALTPTSKAVNITVPTKVSDLENDEGFSTTDTTYTLTKTGSTIVLTSSSGDTTSVEDNDTTYDVATTTDDGLMSSTDKTKLDGMEVAEDSEINAIITEVFGA